LILTLCKHANSSRANYEGWSPYYQHGGSGGNRQGVHKTCLHPTRQYAASLDKGQTKFCILAKFCIWRATSMWKAATRHFASNEWDCKGILDSNERPWRHMAQNCIKTNRTEAPFNLLPGDRVIVLSRTNRGGLWWDRWRQEHWHKISDSIQNY
jgi:hypothetical protein